MAREPVLAAGGIVLQQQETPLIAVVRLRKRNEWVLPKGKLDDGETPRDAAEREVLEETGHDVSVHEFLGTLVYESGGRSKVVHYWRMETSGEQVYELMDDVKAVDWLPLDAAVERLSRGYERAFLANVGPLALAAALPRLARRPTAKPPVLEKRRGQAGVARQASLTIPAPPDLSATAADEHPSAASNVAETTAFLGPAESRTPTLSVEAGSAAPINAGNNDATVSAAPGQRKNLLRKLRGWLRRAS
jgi:8-oxo-dGTP diphosphatase